MEKEQKLKQIKISIIIAIIIIVVPSLIVGIVALKQDIDTKKRVAAEEARLAAQVEVPDVMGMNINEARETLSNAGFEVNLTDYTKEQVESNPSEYVVKLQSPSVGERVDKNTEVKLFFKELMVVKSNNFYGMRFKKTIPEFCESFNKALENEYKQSGENTTSIELYKLKSSSFTYYQTIDSEKVKQYNAQGINYQIMVFTEIDSDKIVYACVGFDKSGVANYDNLQTFVATKIYPAMISSLTGDGYSTALDKFKSIDEKASYSYYKDNICYLYREQGTITYMHIIAMNEEKYNSKILNKTTENDKTTKVTEEENTASIQTGSENSYIIIDVPNFIGKTNTDMIFRYDLRKYIVEKLYNQDLEGTTFNINILKYLDEGSAEIQGNFILYGTGKVTKQIPGEDCVMKIFYDGDGNVKLGQDIKVFCGDATENSEKTILEINK